MFAPLPRLNWFLWVLWLTACGDVESMIQPDTAFADTTSDTLTPDTHTPDTTGPQDTSDPDWDSTPNDTRAPEEDAALFSLKGDDRFIVPGNVAAKTSPAVAGALVAWVEAGALGPHIVVWDTRVLDVGPRFYDVPLLSSPRELALSDAYLAYVDDRYGDPDVFAIDLESGTERAVVTRAGAQEKPTVIGSLVAWEDCRACVSGDGVTGREAARQVYMRDLAGGAETAVSTAGEGAFSPRYGLLADGRQALAWVEGRSAIAHAQVLSGLGGRFDVSTFVPADQEVAGLELVAGLIAWRPRPLIVNPDSMIVNPDSMWPSDLFTTKVDGGDTEAVTVHAELSGRLPGGIHGLGGHLAWIEAVPGESRVGRFIRRDVTSGMNDALFALPDVNGLALSSGYAVVTAPRADNDGLSDLHLFPLDR